MLVRSAPARYPSINRFGLGSSSIKVVAATSVGFNDAVNDRTITDPTAQASRTGAARLSPKTGEATPDPPIRVMPITPAEQDPLPDLKKRTDQMTVAATRPRGDASADVDGRQQLADVFVIFGITGDLAKVMTFHSLYRLEQRGILNCPIVGVGVSDWSVGELRDHARTAIEDCGEHIDDAVFERLAARLA